VPSRKKSALKNIPYKHFERIIPPDGGTTKDERGFQWIRLVTKGR
jgi:hypothetical protein